MRKRCGTCARLLVIAEVPVDKGYGCYVRVKAGTCPYRGGSFRLGNRWACEEHEEAEDER